MSDSITLSGLIERYRLAEKEQALFYRRLAAAAEAADDEALAARFHDLHADEQHHLSRLTARLIELRQVPIDLSDVKSPEATLSSWEPLARSREQSEVKWYETFLEADLDEDTRRLGEEILQVERAHASELSGKWTMA